VPTPVDGCRVLDLACLEGQYAIECALQGASVLGIDAREASLIQRTYEMARRLVVIDTHVSLRPNATVEFQDGTYHGERLPELYATPDGAASGSSGPPSTQELGAGVGNEASFTFSRPSLLNALAAAGFPSVYECLNPPHLGRRGLEPVNPVRSPPSSGGRSSCSPRLLRTGSERAGRRGRCPTRPPARCAT
jgi:hypothetical protein